MDSKALKRAQEQLAANRAEAQRLVSETGLKQTRQLLQRAAQDLEKRLRQAEGLSGPGPGSFTAVQKRAALVQVRAALITLNRGMRGVLVDHGAKAADAGAQGAADYLVAADAAFRGVGQQPLALKVARMLSAGRDGATGSILARIAGDPDHPAQAGVLQRYGLATIEHFEQQMQKGFVAKKSWAEMREDLTAESPFLQGAPRYWADRIVRTETAYALNRGQHEATKEADAQLGDMVRILAATFDDRTAADSYAVHGQIRRPEEPFESWYGAYLHPPNRPNDREILVPHRMAWPIPPYLAWRSDAEVLARWHYEGRKGAPPPRPLMTTVPLSKFGGQPEPAEEDHGEPEIPEREARAPQAAAEEAPWHDPGIPEIPERAPAAAQAPVEEAQFEAPVEPEVLPEPEPAKDMAAEDVLATKVAGAKGSNEGGFYEGADGVRRYVKFYADPSQAYSEHLSNQVYRDLGLEAPESMTFDRDGKRAYASTVVPGLQTLQQVGLTEAAAQKVMRGFAADVLLGNWDAVGTGLDNVGVVGDGVMRVDNGGSLLFRAKAGRKPEHLLGQITEWDKFLSSSANPYYAQVASKAGVSKAEDLGKGLVDQIDRIKKLRKASGGWAAYVEKHAAGMPAADKKRVVDMLEARTKLLSAKVSEVKEAAKKAKVVAKEAKIAEKAAKKAQKELAAAAKKLGSAPPQVYEKLPLEQETARRHFSARHLYGLPNDEEYRKMARAAVSPASSHIDGPRAFTGSSYSEIREHEWNPTAPASASIKDYARDIEKFFATAKAAPPGTVFRGITGVSENALNRFLSEPLFKFSSTTSVSRSGDTSKSFAGGMRKKGDVFFAIEHRTAVPAETFSNHPSESELLMRKGTTFHITRRYKTESGAIVIEAREIGEGGLTK